MLQMLRVLKMTQKTCSCSRPWQCLWRGMLVCCNLEIAVKQCLCLLWDLTSQCASMCALCILASESVLQAASKRTAELPGKQGSGNMVHWKKPLMMHRIRLQTQCQQRQRRKRRLQSREKPKPQAGLDL